jgi:hypothetical protein
MLEMFLVLFRPKFGLKNTSYDPNGEFKVALRGHDRSCPARAKEAKTGQKSRTPCIFPPFIEFCRSLAERTATLTHCPPHGPCRSPLLTAYAHAPTRAHTRPHAPTPTTRTHTRSRTHTLPHSHALAPSHSRTHMHPHSTRAHTRTSN